MLAKDSKNYKKILEIATDLCKALGKTTKDSEDLYKHIEDTRVFHDTTFKAHVKRNARRTYLSMY